MFADNFRNMFSILLVILAAKIRLRPLVMWTAVIQTPYERRRKGTLRHWLEDTYRRFLCKQVDAFVAVSELAKNLLKQYGVSKERIYRTAYFAQEASSHCTSKSEAKRLLGLDGNVILFMGYLVESKGIDFLIGAYKSLKPRDTILVIAGSGPELKRIELLAGSYKGIRLVGHIQGEEKELYFCAADIFVLPSLHDDWGRVVSEAVNYGLPIITTEMVGAAPDLVRENGLILPAGDEIALAQALDRLLADDALREAMGARSVQINKEFDLYYAKRGFVAAINSVAGSSRVAG